MADLWKQPFKVLESVVYPSNESFKSW